MADKFLHELDATTTLSNEDLLLISKKDNEGNYTTEYAEVGTLSGYVSAELHNELSGEFSDSIKELSDALTNHIEEKDTTDKLHITSEERTTWSAAATSINDFLSGADNAAKAIDTLKEIQEWFANDENGTAASILEAIATLQTAVNDLQTENTSLKNKLAAYDERFGYTDDENGKVNWTVNFLKINSPAKS